MVAIGFLGLQLGTALLTLLSGNNVKGEVGIFQSGVSLDISSTFSSGLWALGRDGCRVGRPGNLVVVPRYGSSRDGGEILDTTGTGPRLCSWLSTMEKAHESMRRSWEAEHSRRRSQVSMWNIFKRFILWRRKFPRFEVEVRTHYLDLWNKDRFGHPLPWIVATFRYKCPDSDKSYGLLNHLCGSVFAKSADPGLPTNVVLLLQPRQGYNHPLTVTADNSKYITGFISGLRGVGTTRQKSGEDMFAWAAASFGHLGAFMTITGRIDDLWMNGTHCYFMHLLRVEWDLFEDTVCERLHEEANQGALSALKASTVSSVRLNLSGLDFFNYSTPVMFGQLDEGILTINAGSLYLMVEIDTNPWNVPNFERSRSTMQNVRAASLMVDSLAGLFSLRRGKD